MREYFTIFFQWAVNALSNGRVKTTDTCRHASENNNDCDTCMTQSVHGALLLLKVKKSGQ